MKRVCVLCTWCGVLFLCQYELNLSTVQYRYLSFHISDFCIVLGQFWCHQGYKFSTHRLFWVIYSDFFDVTGDLVIFDFCLAHKSHTIFDLKKSFGGPKQTISFTFDPTKDK